MENGNKRTLTYMRMISLAFLIITVILLSFGIPKLVSATSQSYDDWDFPADKEVKSGAIAMVAVGGFIGFLNFPLFMFSFIVPLMTKMSIAATSSVFNQNKEELSDLAKQQAEISKEAITITTSAAREGFEKYGKDTVYCKYCGNKIDSDSAFCKFCGRKQEE